VDEEMSYINFTRDPFLDSLDQAIIEAIKHKPFMTGKEIWETVQRRRSRVSPGLVYCRVNQLLERGVVGRLEKKVGNTVLRRYYCFHDKPNFKLRRNNFTSEIKN
jgi:Fe2+ or Zn2+ uptake regulation protein